MIAFINHFTSFACLTVRFSTIQFATWWKSLILWGSISLASSNICGCQVCPRSCNIFQINPFSSLQSISYSKLALPSCLIEPMWDTKDSWFPRIRSAAVDSLHWVLVPSRTNLEWARFAQLGVLFSYTHLIHFWVVMPRDSTGIFDKVPIGSHDTSGSHPMRFSYLPIPASSNFEMCWSRLGSQKASFLKPQLQCLVKYLKCFRIPVWLSKRPI